MNNDFSYIKTLQKTLDETRVRELAQSVMFANQSTPTFVESQLTAIRQKLVENKINTFTTTKRKVSELRALAHRARVVTSNCATV